jgi:RNA polymerase sigma-70 factor (ECF subfamily)
VAGHWRQRSIGGVNSLARFPTNTRTPTDADRAALADLIARAQAGESPAQTKLVRRYTNRIAAFVRPIINQPSAVDDVVQMVFIKMLRRLGALRDAGAFESWLLALARNTAVDFIRRRRCRPATVWDEHELTEAPDTCSLRRVAEIMEALDHALRSLSPRDRNIVMMIVQGNSYQTTAAREGLSIGAVKLRLNRVRPFLRVSVGEAIGTGAATRAWRRPPRGRMAA